MLNPSNPQRNWFPVILAGLTVLLAIVFYATNRSVDFSAWMASWSESGVGSRTSESVADPITEEEYQAAVRSIIVNADSDEQAMYDAFVLLRVPKSMQTFHIDLIIAFGKLASGDHADGEARLEALAAQYPWFSM